MLNFIRQFLNNLVYVHSHKREFDISNFNQQTNRIGNYDKYLEEIRQAIKGDDVKSLDGQDGDKKAIAKSPSMRKTAYTDENYHQLSLRDTEYTELLKGFCRQYITRQEKKEIQKWKFYGLISIVFENSLRKLFWILLALFVLGIIKQEIISVIPAIVTSLIGILGTLLSFPTIIAKYFFNPDEDKDVTKIVLTMQSQDLANRRGFVSPASEKDVDNHEDS